MSCHYQFENSSLGGTVVCLWKKMFNSSLPGHNIHPSSHISIYMSPAPWHYIVKCSAQHAFDLQIQDAALIRSPGEQLSNHVNLKYLTVFHSAHYWEGSNSYAEKSLKLSQPASQLPALPEPLMLLLCPKSRIPPSVPVCSFSIENAFILWNISPPHSMCTLTKTRAQMWAERHDR